MLYEVITVVSYDWQNQSAEPQVVKPLALSTDGEGIVVVDDLVDSGNTLRYVRTLLPKARFATIYRNNFV